MNAPLVLSRWKIMTTLPCMRVRVYVCGDEENMNEKKLNFIKHALMNHPMLNITLSLS